MVLVTFLVVRNKVVVIIRNCNKTNELTNYPLLGLGLLGVILGINKMQYLELIVELGLQNTISYFLSYTANILHVTIHSSLYQ